MVLQITDDNDHKIHGICDVFMLKALLGRRRFLRSVFFLDSRGSANAVNKPASYSFRSNVSTKPKSYQKVVFNKSHELKIDDR